MTHHICAERGTGPIELPVYDVVETGIEERQARRLAGALGIPADRLAWHGGHASFVDPESYLALPTITITDSEVGRAHCDTTTNHHPGLPLEVRALDYEALGRVGEAEDARALDSVAKALDAAEVKLQSATPFVGHTVLTTTAAPGLDGVAEHTRTALDTHVHHRFTLDGYLLVGPGAQCQVSFDRDERPTRLVCAVRHLTPGATVQLLPEDAIRERFGRHLLEGAEITVRIVYWAPPLQCWVTAPEQWRPGTILPWYAVRITRPVQDLRSGVEQRVTSRIHLVPATDDARYVPSVTVSARAPERSRVSARATATGGTPPYTFLWAGSNPDASSERGPTIHYEPRTRDLRRFLPAQSLDRTEQISVTVLDANGIRVQAGDSVPVTARAAEETHSSVTYGCESPNDPGPSGDGSYAPERIAWQQAMGWPGQGGGSQRFCWLEDSSWPGDFIEPNPPGSIEPSPWINGDADHANWGINTTNIMLYNGDGSPGGFCEMYPGAATTDYNTGSGSGLFTPGPGTTVAIGSQGYAVNYSGSWGAPHPNDNLQWLAMYACQILENDSNASAPWNRWGPAFNGLHSLLGFETEASDNGVGFMTDFPFSILGFTFPLFGLVLPPHTVLQGWLSTAIANQMGTPAAMGPIHNVRHGDRTVGIMNVGDYYWGKGPVGPSIPQSQINGWWYIQGSDALQEFP